MAPTAPLSFLGEQVEHQKFAAEALMVPLATVVLHKRTKQMPKMCFPKDHKPLETLFANCTNEALRIGIAVGTLRGNGYAAHAGVAQ